ncbi:MAG: FtsQ-type POTRA domain-containing protein [Streptosporangiales bacterium]|nr:FtsQ-type POTRA domain-containing protein [Streptosporangiales bacterium]
MSTTRSTDRAATGRSGSASGGAPGRRGRGVKVFGVLLALAAIGGWLYLLYGSGVFAARTVEVTGVHRLDAAQVRKAAAVPMGTPLARIDVDAVEARVARLAQVEEVSVGRSWPTTLRIEIRERVPVVAVERNGSWWLIDHAAVVVATQAKRPSLPVLGVATPRPGDSATTSALAVVERLPDSLRDDVRRVSATSEDSVRLHLPRSVVVVWGNPSQSTEKARVLAALRKAEPKGRVYDVSTPATATVRRR